MTEYDLIRQLAAGFSRCPQQQNALFECDAELLRIGDQLWALTLDEFTPEEDRFGDLPPAALGANLATATLSDLLAAGAEPKFMLQALALPPNVAPEFVTGLTSGLRSVLDQAGCSLCGGDLGTAATWRFTGFAMGPVPGGRALTRRLPRQPQTLWCTGRLGDANLAALRQQPAPVFEYRGPEAGLLRTVATACIDTSGGLLDALWQLAEQSPGIGFELALEHLPLAPGIAEFAAAQRVPPEAFLLGGAGEYELLFATPSDLPQAALEQLQALGITAIGRAAPDLPPGIRFARPGRPASVLTTAPPCPRAAPNLETHIRDVLTLAQHLFG